MGIFIALQLKGTADIAAAVRDDILDSVDLSTYGLERTQLDRQIELDDAESEVESLNANPRGAHGGGGDEEELDLIIRSFNERYFQG